MAPSFKRSALLLLGLTLVASVARSEGNNPLARGIDPVVFKLSPSMNAYLTVEGARLEAAGSYQLSLAADYNKGLLAFKVGDDQRADLIAHRVDFHLLGSAALTDRFELGLDIPFTPYQANGFDKLKAQTGFADTPPASAGMGDIRLLGRFGLLSEVNTPVGLAGVIEARGLTGAGRSFLGERGVLLTPRLVVERRITPIFTASASAGYQYRTKAGQYLNLYVGDQFSAGLAGALALPDTSSLKSALQLEILLATPARAPFTFASSDALKTPLEALLGWRGWFHDRIGVQAGIGRGITGDGGYGREDFRAFASVTLRGKSEPKLNTDRDNDNDSDGVLDVEDQCPDVPGPAPLDGCPDRDHDDIPDVSDQCPDEPGPATTEGCPVKNKPLIVYEDGKLVMFGAITFDTGKDTIKTDSFPILDEAAHVFSEHPELKRVRVDGHTDSVGGDETNLDLSKRRAAAILRYLVDHGIRAERLTSEGYGKTKPIADNRTALGRAKNRRVEFTVLENTNQPGMAQPAGDNAPAPKP